MSGKLQDEDEQVHLMLSREAWTTPATSTRQLSNYRKAYTYIITHAFFEANILTCADMLASYRPRANAK
jgi:hypothetical protein